MAAAWRRRSNSTWRPCARSAAGRLPRRSTSSGSSSANCVPTATSLYREVHYLAYHYHWSESEIMAMTRDKRHTYIDVLADEIDGLNSGT